VFVEGSMFFITMEDMCYLNDTSFSILVLRIKCLNIFFEKMSDLFFGKF